MGFYFGTQEVSSIIAENGQGGSGTTIRAYLPDEYSGSTEKGTKLLLNTKDYYVQETAEWEAEPAASLYCSWENSMIGDECALYGSDVQAELYRLYKNNESEFVTSHANNLSGTVVFLANTKDCLLRYDTNYLYIESFGGGNLTTTNVQNRRFFGGTTPRTGAILSYIPFVVKKEEPYLIRTISINPSNGQFEFTLNLKDKTYSWITNKNGSTKLRVVGLWATEPTKRMYVLLLDSASGTLSTYYWDSVEHAGGGKGLTATGQTLPTISAAFQYAVQFPTTLTINGEEVMYSFLNTGGDLYVYSFKESTMMWAEEPEIAQLIKDQLGAFSDNVHIQPQMDGTLYCTNDLIMCAFSFNSDGTITQVAHPCSDYVGQLENLVEFNATVNKYAGTAGLCYRLSTDTYQQRGYMYHFVYFKLEPHEDTGELEWVAYDKKRSNYAVESITGISTGVTGTTEDGRNYVECTVSLPK